MECPGGAQGPHAGPMQSSWASCSFIRSFARLTEDAVHQSGNAEDPHSTYTYPPQKKQPVISWLSGLFNSHDLSKEHFCLRTERWKENEEALPSPFKTVFRFRFS